MIVGLVWWLGLEVSFWGYNVMICIIVFVESCGLLILFGGLLFGGVIMSYDMVEVVLLWWCGWVVYLIMIDDSYEEYLLMLIDFVVCDWCWV